MISQLTGVVIRSVMDSSKGAFVILDVHGVGYEIMTIASVVSRIQTTAEPQVAWTFYTQPVIREDHWQLVGFLRDAERDMFALLQQASGVGARMALAVMGALSLSDICQAIQQDQPEVLTVAKGVGPKLAKKMVLELKDKVRQWEYVADVGGGRVEAGQEVGTLPSEVDNVLMSLGYTPAEIGAAYRHWSGTSSKKPETVSCEELLKDMLGALSR